MTQPNYKSTTVFPECDLPFIEMYKIKTFLNKPIYCGISILDLSKTLMYDFYYNQLKREYKDRVKVLYTDTNSLLFAIYTDDIHKDIKKRETKYNLSNYNPDHPLYNPKKRKYLVKWKTIWR